MQLQLGPLVDVAIAVCGLFVAISTVCSFLTEQIAVFLKLRGEKLYTAVLNLVFSQDLADKIFAHPLIDVTVNDQRGPGKQSPGALNRPSYIDPTKFAAAFWDELANVSTLLPSARAQAALADATAANDQRRIAAARTLQALRANADAVTGTAVLPPDAHFEDLRQVVNALPATDSLKQNVLVLLATAKEDYQSVLAVTGAWFDHQMDRVSGWYARQAQYIVIACAAMIVFISGLDTLEIARGLYAAPTLVAAVDGITSAYGSGQSGASGGSTGHDAAPSADDAKAALTRLRGDTFAAYFHPLFGLWSSPEQDQANALAYEAAYGANAVANATRDADVAAAMLARHDALDAFEKLDAEVLSYHGLMDAYRAADGDYLKTKGTYDHAVQVASIDQAALSAALGRAKAARELSLAALTTGNEQLKTTSASASAMVADLGKSEKKAESDVEAAQTTAAALATASGKVGPGGTIAAHWFGWLITFAAASLGAPFWFNVLGTFINVRGTGPKPKASGAVPGATPNSAGS